MLMLDFRQFLFLPQVLSGSKRVLRKPTLVQLMRGDFHETVLYWAGVVSVRLGAIAEKKVSPPSCVWGSVQVRQPVHQLFHTAVRTFTKLFMF